MDWGMFYALYAAKIGLLVLLHELLHFIPLKLFKVDFKTIVTPTKIGFWYDETKYPKYVTVITLAAPQLLIPLALWLGWVYLIIYVVASLADLLNIVYFVIKGKALI